MLLKHSLPVKIFALQDGNVVHCFPFDLLNWSVRLPSVEHRQVYDAKARLVDLIALERMRIDFDN